MKNALGAMPSRLISANCGSRVNDLPLYAAGQRAGFDLKIICADVIDAQPLAKVIADGGQTWLAPSLDLPAYG
jgi:hypothetical protein